MKYIPGTIYGDNTYLGLSSNRQYRVGCNKCGNIRCLPPSSFMSPCRKCARMYNVGDVINNKKIYKVEKGVYHYKCSNGHMGTDVSNTINNKCNYCRSSKYKIGTIISGRMIVGYSRSSMKMKCNICGKISMMEGHKKNRCRCVGNSKAILQCTLDGIIIKEYPSIKMATEALGISRSCIYVVLRGKCKTSGGYIWKYAE